MWVCRCVGVGLCVSARFVHAHKIQYTDYTQTTSTHKPHIKLKSHIHKAQTRKHRVHTHTHTKHKACFMVVRCVFHVCFDRCALCFVLGVLRFGICGKWLVVCHCIYVCQCVCVSVCAQCVSLCASVFVSVASLPVPFVAVYVFVVVLCGVLALDFRLGMWLWWWL